MIWQITRHWTPVVNHETSSAKRQFQVALSYLSTTVTIASSTLIEMYKNGYHPRKAWRPRLPLWHIACIRVMNVFLVLPVMALESWGHTQGHTLVVRLLSILLSLCYSFYCHVWENSNTKYIHYMASYMVVLFPGLLSPAGHTLVIYPSNSGWTLWAVDPYCHFVIQSIVKYFNEKIPPVVISDEEMVWSCRFNVIKLFYIQKI